MNKAQDTVLNVDGGGDAERQHAAPITAFHLIVICLSLLMTISAWQFSKYQIENRTEMRFENSRDQVPALITDRMRKYEDALWAGVSAVDSHGGDMSREEWRTFASALRIEEKYPGISGIGMVHFLTEQTKPEYLAERRQETPGFRIHPEHDLSTFLPISFVEPEESNAAAVGLDLAFEVNRRTAALASRDTGTAQISGPIVLVQDAGHTPGFLFYAPFYQANRPDTVSERRARATGTVYAPFVLRKLMEGLLSKDRRDVRFSIRDGDQVIYDEHAEDDPLNDANPLYSDRMSLDLYGRTWELDIRTNLAFRSATNFAQPTLILLGGLVIEALIISLLIMLGRANTQAVAYADAVTAALRRKSEQLVETNRELSDSNQELEQFAYVTSHDLKTPVRGISGLIDMLEDDLGDHLAANPAIGRNLHRMRERVTRMNALTSGINEFARIGRYRHDDTALDLPETLEAMISDFGLSPDQLRLVGTVETIHVDTFTFRRVLENLVGNAIKHNPDVEALRIVISATKSSEGYRIDVSDNGPGIAPRYHGKIFEIFQTLRTGDAPESTGIGLAIVRKAVERHGGSVTVTSAPGAGATFTFTWPDRKPDAAPMQTSEAA